MSILNVVYHKCLCLKRTRLCRCSVLSLYFFTVSVYYCAKAEKMSNFRTWAVALKFRWGALFSNHVRLAIICQKNPCFVFEMSKSAAFKPNERLFLALHYNLVIWESKKQYKRVIDWSFGLLIHFPGGHDSCHPAIRVLRTVLPIRSELSIAPVI